MNKLILALGILLIILAGIIHFSANKMDQLHKDELAKADKKIDSLTKDFNTHEATIALLEQTAAHERKNYLKADSTTKAIKAQLSKQTAYYHKKIQTVTSFTDEKLDSAVTALYPDTLRPSFNQNLRPIPIFNWRLRSLVQDRLRLDSAYAVIHNKDSTITSQQSSLDTRDRFITVQDKMLTEKNSSITDLKGIVMQKDTKIQVYKDESKQYKKQRNIAGGVAILTTILSVVAH